MEAPANLWKKCSVCKKPILLGSNYYQCSVSTCTSDRTGYVFCGIQCFESHLPGARHRDAGAVEKRAPMTASPASASNPTPSSDGPKRIIPKSPVPTASGASAFTASATTSHAGKSSMENEVLVVVSKMKQYIKDVSDMNTAEDVNRVISQMIRLQLDRAIENAKRDGRKTVMARDFKI